MNICFVYEAMGFNQKWYGISIGISSICRNGLNTQTGGLGSLFYDLRKLWEHVLGEIRLSSSR